MRAELLAGSVVTGDDLLLIGPGVLTLESRCCRRYQADRTGVARRPGAIEPRMYMELHCVCRFSPTISRRCEIAACAP